MGAAVCLDKHAHGLGHAYRIGNLHEAFVTHSGGDKVLGDVACCIGAAAVNLGRVFAGECAAAVGSAATVGIDYNLAPGEAGISGGPAYDELSGGVDVQYPVTLEQRCGAFWQ